VSEQPQLVVDCLGRPCPVPVIELAKALPSVALGEVVEVVSDDPAARLDVPAWCRMREQAYLGEHPRDRGAGYRVRRTT
jgi:cysteine desulfurase